MPRNGTSKPQPSSSKRSDQRPVVVRLRDVSQRMCALAAGFDPYWGFYHRRAAGGRAGTRSYEEFHPVVDSAVITAINTGMESAIVTEIARQAAP